MRCLVLGGGGFIGSHLCDRLVEAGQQVRVFERIGSSGIHLIQLGDRIERFQGDFSNDSDLKVAVEGVDVIYHLICTTIPQSSNFDILKDIESNVISTVKLLDLARSSGVRKIIFSSSGGTVYGIPQSIPISVEHPNHPISSYGIHKLMIEKYLDLYYNLFGLDYSVMRISNPYGERQRPTGKQGAVAVFLYKALRGEPIEIWGDGSVVRDYLHVTDVVTAAMKLAGGSYEEKIFNVGSGVGVSLNQLLTEIEKVTGNSLDVRYTAGRSVDIPVNILDISRTKEALDWEPKVGFSEGLHRTADYLQKFMLESNKYSY